MEFSESDFVSLWQNPALLRCSIPFHHTACAEKSGDFVTVRMLFETGYTGNAFTFEV